MGSTLVIDLKSILGYRSIKPKQQKGEQTLIVLITSGMMSLFFANAVAGENRVQTVTNGCKQAL
jgi:hypothetical protein